MGQLSLSEISLKYGISQPDISKAITRDGVRPNGQRFYLECNRTLRTYDERDTVEAVARLWEHRAESFIARGNVWNDKTERLITELEHKCLPCEETQEPRKTVND